MARIVVLVSNDIIENIEKNKIIYKIKKFKNNEQIFEYINRNYIVIALYDRVEYDALDVSRKLSAMGRNPMMFMPVSVREAGISSLSLTDIINHKISFLLSNYNKIINSSINKEKRIILPILKSEATCLMTRGCNECVNYCPHNAITGKPPRVNTDLCTGCGICTASCPLNLLEMPGISYESLDYLLGRLSRVLSGGVLVFACYEDYSRVVEELEKLDRHAFIVPLPCVGWITPGHALQALYHGFPVVTVCGKESVDNRTGGWEWGDALEGLPVVLDPIPPERLANVILELPSTPVLGDNALSIPRPRLVHLVAEAYGLDILHLGAPLVGDVSVDRSRCMVCDACSSMCPYGALSLVVDGDRIRLLFDHSRCVACHLCEYACTYNAIKIEYKYDKNKFMKKEVLAEDEVARCRICGAPLGSMKMMKHIENMLRKQGANELALKQLWLCPKCKLKGLAENL